MSILAYVSKAQLIDSHCCADLNIMFREFFGESTAAARSGVDSIVDSDLTILVIQPAVNVLSAPLKDLLTQHD